MRTCKHGNCGGLMPLVARYCPQCGRKVGIGRAVPLAIAAGLLVVSATLFFVAQGSSGSMTAVSPVHTVAPSVDRPVFTRPPGRP